MSGLEDGNILYEGDRVEYEREYDDIKRNYRAEKITGASTVADGGARGGYEGGGGQQVCNDFQRGRCTRGDRCRYCASLIWLAVLV